MVMSVNALVTGLIVFRILKVFLEVKGTSSSTSDSIAGGTTLRHIIFVIIESGMALFASQMVRFILALLPVKVEADPIGLIYGINEMFYVIIRSIRFYLFCFTDKIYLARPSHQQ